MYVEWTVTYNVETRNRLPFTKHSTLAQQLSHSKGYYYLFYQYILTPENLFQFSTKS